jgi:hypothetical protein
MSVHPLMSLLDGVGERTGAEWSGIADQRLEASLTRYESVQDLIHAVESEGSFSAAEVAALRQVEDQLAGVWVEVRISGRGDDQAEMLELVEHLLSEGGYAFDDRPNRAWSLEQIRTAAQRARPSGPDGLAHPHQSRIAACAVGVNAAEAVQRPRYPRPRARVPRDQRHAARRVVVSEFRLSNPVAAGASSRK